MAREMDVLLKNRAARFMQGAYAHDIAYFLFRSAIKMKKRFSFCIVLAKSYLWQPPKVLTLDNKTKKMVFRFVLCSLNRTFALDDGTCTLYYPSAWQVG